MKNPLRLPAPLLVAAAAVPLLLAVPAARAQDAPRAQTEPSADPAPGVFAEVVDVDVVDVEVVVTDDQGRPILGLTADDFEVYEDGERMELTNFYAVSAGQRVPEEAEGELWRAPSRHGIEALTQPRDQRLNLIILIDNANLAAGDRRRALESLVEQLGATLRPRDRVMLAELAPELRIVHPFSDRLGPIVDRLRDLGRQAPSQMGLEMRRRQVLALVNRDNQTSASAQVSRADLASSALHQVRSYASEADAHNRRTLKAIERLVASLAGVEGRKAVLYVSDGFETRPAESLLEFWYELFGDVARDPSLGFTQPAFEANEWDVRTELARLVAGAAADRVTFYALDAGGARSVASADHGAGLIDATTVRDTSEEEPLLYLAAATGGSALLGTSEPGALLARMEDDYSDYYSLGYVSPNQGDGEHHRIEVRVPGRDLRLRYPKGYRAKSMDQRMREQTLSALNLDAGANPMEVTIRLGPEERENRRLWVLPVLVKVPISNILLVPREHLERHEGKVTFYLAVSDEEGRVSEPQKVELPVTIPTSRLEEALGKELGYGINLRVRPGRGKLAVSVRDELAGTTSSVHLPISIGG